jgi:hypothetical protein
MTAIKAEGLRSSEAPVLFHALTDVFGARLTGSPAHLEAARWALERFRRWGLQNPQLEPFEFGRGWALEKLTVEMIAPRYMPLIGYAEAWSPPTAGVLTGVPIYIGDSTAIDIERLDERLRGAIVLTHRQQTEFLRTDRMQPSDGNGPVQTGNPPLPGPSSVTPALEMLARLAQGRGRLSLAERREAAALAEQGVGAFGDVPELAPALGRVVVKGGRLGLRAGCLSELGVTRAEGVLGKWRSWLDALRESPGEHRIA